MTLGMDVPFFLRGGAALGTGRGEHLRPLQTVGLSLVLVSPRIGASTAETYGRVTPAMFTGGEHARAPCCRPPAVGRPARVAEHLYNGLEAALGPAARQVVRMKAALLAAGALGAAMSGSGPTVFGARPLLGARAAAPGATGEGIMVVLGGAGLRGPAMRLRAQ